MKSTFAFALGLVVPVWPSDHNRVHDYYYSSPPQGPPHPSEVVPPQWEQQQQYYEPQEDPRPTLTTRSVGLAASGVVGLGLSKATTGIWRPRWIVWGGLVNGAAQAAGGRFGEFADATSKTVLGASWRFKELSEKGEYPVFKQLKAATGLIPRRRYPAENEQFSMLRCILGAVCLAGIGVALSPPIPFIPSSLVAILAAVLAVFTVTLRDARGDAARCLVARSIAVAGIFYTSASEARLGPTFAAALRLSGDRLSRFDQRFHISARLGAFAARVFASAQQRQQTTEPPTQQQRPRTPTDPLAAGDGYWSPYEQQRSQQYRPPDVPPHYQQPPPPPQRDQDHDWSF